MRPPAVPTPSCFPGCRSATALLLWLLLCQVAAAASPAPFVLSRFEGEAVITAYSEFLEDPDGQLTLEQVRAPDRAFRPAADGTQNIGFTRSVWWIRVVLDNPAPTSRTLMLSLLPGRLAELTLYRQDTEGRWQASHGGVATDRVAGDYGGATPAWLLDLPAGQQREYYLRARPEQGFSYQLLLHTPQALVRDGNLTSQVTMSAIGILLAMMLVLAVQSRLFRSRHHLLYAAFLGSLLVGALAQQGKLGYEFLHVPGLQPRLEALGLLLACCFSVAFSQRLLPLPRRGLFRRLWQSQALVLTGGLLALPFLPMFHLLLWAYLAAALHGLMVLLLGLRAWRRQQPGGLAYLLARLPLVLCVLLTVLSALSVLSLGVDCALLLILVAALESLLFTLLLSRVSRDRLLRTLAERRQLAVQQSIAETRRNTLARLSHEIRTPMSGILGMAEILDDTALTPNQRDCVQSIRQSGEALLKVLNDVLEYHRLEDGPQALEIGPLDLNQVIMAVIELFRERASEKQVELILHLHTNVPRHVLGDGGRLKQVLVNLVGTCVRHAQPGELVLDVARDPSGLAHHLRLELEGSALQDEGPFQHLLLPQRPEQEAPDPTRLGQIIAAHLIQSLNGRLSLRRGRNGVVVTLTLPLPPVEAPDPDHAHQALLEGRSMLVVDDSRTVTRVIRQQALSWGMRVTVCHDPREALASLRTQTLLGEPFDVVLLDQRMPGMTGLQLAARILDAQPEPPPRLLALCDTPQRLPPAVARTAGFHQVLVKPVTGVQLRRALIELLSPSPPPPATATPAPTPDPSLHILVAEDHALSQRITRRMLAKLGLEADVVGNGRDAVDAVRSGRYDLVLMDCEMPGMDGFEAARMIREWEQASGRPPLPIIALTAHIMREHQERTQLAGMDAHVAKPVELDRLRDVISRFRPARPTQPPPPVPDAPPA